MLERIQNTLSYEMCHLACRVINQDPKEGHRKAWKSWWVCMLGHFKSEREREILHPLFIGIMIFVRRAWHESSIFRAASGHILNNHNLTISTDLQIHISRRHLLSFSPTFLLSLKPCLCQCQNLAVTATRNHLIVSSPEFHVIAIYLYPPTCIPANSHTLLRSLPLSSTGIIPSLTVSLVLTSSSLYCLVFYRVCSIGIASVHFWHLLSSPPALW